MVFFQAALLGGYAYAHATTAWLGIRRQTILHLALLAVPLAVLPLGVDASRLPGGEANPVLGVLVLLSLSVGLPFFVVSATAPLLQHWFTHTGHRAARDPYFLYAASNLGSMLALLSYPSLIEPRLRLRDAGWLAQTRLWTLGYLLLAVLIVLCAVVAAQAERRADRGRTGRRRHGARAAAVGRGRRAERAARRPSAGACYWVALAFAPSSLLLGATTYVTTDIAALPLLWVLPLAIYLLSFILAFGRWPAALHRVVSAATLPARPPRDVLHDLALPAAELGDGALALSPALRRRPRLPWRAGDRPALPAAPHRVLPPHLRGRRARRNRQCADRAPGLQLAAGVPARDGARVCARGGDPRAAGRRARPAAIRGAAARGDPARARALLGEPHPPGRHRLPRPRVRPRLPPHHDVDQPGRAAREQALDLRRAAAGVRPAVAAAARPRRGPGGRARRGGLRRRAEQRGDPAGAELLRRASRHARPRHQGLHGAAPRHDAARPAGQ